MEEAASEVEREVDDKTDVLPADMSLVEKIKLIIQKNPDYGAYKIKKELNSLDYGFMKIGWFTVRNELIKMGLKSKSQRFAFAAKSGK
jgi:hypothetical protein